MKDEITKILVDGSSQKDEIMQGQLIVIPRRIQPRRVKIIKKPYGGRALVKPTNEHKNGWI